MSRKYITVFDRDDAIVVCGVTSLDFNNNVDFAEVDCLVLFLGLLTGVVE